MSLIITNIIVSTILTYFLVFTEEINKYFV